MRFCSFISLIVGLSILSLPAFGNGNDSWENDYIELLLERVETGDKVSQFLLGKAYYEGQGVEKNYETALQWFNKSAEQNYPNALFSLGMMYDDGLGTKQDYKAAFSAYRKAADYGHTMAQYYLGLMYRDGHGVEQDHLLALQWLQKAEENGIKGASRALNGPIKK